MIFSETPLKGAFLINIEPHQDDRGFFARTFCREEFEKHGLNPNVVQCNISWNARAGTLRGMHFQAAPHSEAKLVRCTRGGIHDVIVDLRPESPTYRHQFAVELSAENRQALFIPEFFAHGFQTLLDDTEIEYQMGEFYTPGYGRGFRYDDPIFGIEWPLPDKIVSEQDLAWPSFS
ncbi:MAG TPA: dTDP-4-dehydrorhamnose 3,5-epimerase [Chthoniobacterales bacterium]